MNRRSGFAWDDAFAVGTLLSTAVVIAWPILRGGHLSYIDNPVHLAEIHELASNRAAGWSELGFLGFALDNLHSPLWYSALAALSRVMGSIEWLYAGLLVLGFVAPALSVFAVARRRASPLWALCLAYVVLIQAPMIRGICSPLAGMWTHALGAAGVVLLADALARPELGPLQHLRVALILALTALTHLFALQAAVLVIVITTLSHWRAKNLSQRELVWRTVACLVAAAASASYWLTFLMTTRTELAPQGVLGPKELLVNLLVPSEILYLLEQQIKASLRLDLFMTDAIPMVGVLALGILGFVRRSAKRDALTRTGFWLAVSVLGTLLVNSIVPLPWLGPVSFRHLLWVQIGAALSAIGWLASLGDPKLLSKKFAWLPALLVGLGLWWGRPLANDRPALTPDEWRDLESLWRWLGEHDEFAEGRVYLQDTFGQGWGSGGLTHSHALVLTRSHTGQRQLGVYYGVVPFNTRWTLSEFGRLYHQRFLDPEAVNFAVNRTNTSLLVASSGEARGWLAESSAVEPVGRIGRYSIWRPKNRGTGWVDPLEPTNDVRVIEFRTGEVRLEQSSGGTTVIKVGFHPWWRVEGAAGAILTETIDGLLALRDVPPGPKRMTLRYVPSPWPRLVTWIGWIALLVWAAARPALSLRSRLRRPPAALPPC